MQVRSRGVTVSLRRRDSGHFADDRAAFFGVFMLGEYDQSLSRLRRGDTVIDAGANIGCFTLLAARRVGREGKVLAIEPDSANVSCLKQNLAINEVTNVDVLNVALQRTGVQVAAFEGGGLTAKCSSSGTTWVDCVDLGQIVKLAEVTTVGLLKVDIEGSEVDVFGDSKVGEALSSIAECCIELHSGRARDVVTTALENQRFAVTSPRSERDRLAMLITRAVQRPDLFLAAYGFDAWSVLKRLLFVPAQSGSTSSIGVSTIITAHREPRLGTNVYRKDVVGKQRHQNV